MNWIGVTPASPLELLHPAGAVGRMLVLGERCPPSLVPQGATAADEDVDLVLIAPSPAELRRRGWLDRAVADAERALAPEGLAYALLPRGRRGAARRRLRAAGFVLESPLAQLSESGAPRYLIPVAAGPWRYALTRQIGARPVARRLLAALGSSARGRSLLVAGLPSLGVLARRPGASPTAGWLAQLGGDAREVSAATVATSWRGPVGPIVISAFARGEASPWGVAKLGSSSAAEALRLEQVGGPAGAAGARVPRLLATGRAGERPVLVQTVVEGRAAADVLAGAPGRRPQVTGALSTWLERWNRATVTAAPALDRIEDELRRPARELGDELPAGYLDWLEERGAALAEGDLPVVARHNDLTMWNVRLDGSSEIGVLDWADADRGFALTDLFYALADAAAACDGYRDRVASLEGALGEIAPLADRLRQSLGLSAEAAELAFHACWLRHACNEQRTRGDGEFLRIMRWVAARALEESR